MVKQFAESALLNSKKTGYEVVYKPTTNDPADKDFQYLKPEQEGKKSDSAFLYFAVFIADLLGFAGGVGLSWTSPVIPKLQSSESPLNAPINVFHISLLGALLAIGKAVGPFVFGHLADRIGRKKTLIAISVPMLMGMVIFAFATDIRWYYLARLLYGMGIGGCSSILSVYIGEITEQHNRGKLGCVYTMLLSLGILYPYSVGPFLSVRMFCLSCLIPILIFIIFFTIFVPESPLYYLKVGRKEDAEKALRVLRNKSDHEIQREMLHFREFLDTNTGQSGSYLDLFKTRGLRRSLSIGVGLMIVIQCTGVGAVTSYMQNIFIASGSYIPPQYATIIVGCVKFLIVFVTSYVVERVGRRMLLFSSALAITVPTGILGLYFFLKSCGFDMDCVSWLPVLCLMVYVVSFNFGLGPVIWIIIGEIFPPNMRATASAFVNVVCYVGSFLVMFLYPIISEYLGMAAAFWIFSCCCLAGSVFIYFVVPETKGKSLAEIQVMLSD
ncbi:facilitated trehalose transporter Tret1-like [Cylas formicarius]|uniref:facilitated trehalose transporter Tret1-like n=1 Tax=Cylas formicarius TaxID=197179 RepID=UPI0029585603|nr:facilitated trehalose transporter Tret1-like [Cylas formicarius]